MSAVPPRTPSAPARPALRGWLHVAGAVALPACSPILLLRCHNAASLAWTLCYLVGVEVMLATSAVFHRGNWSPGARRAWRRADHSAIFVAITGSYLAVAGLTLHGTVRVALIVAVAVGAAAGIVIRQLTIDTPRLVNTIPFVIVGWAAVAVLPQLYRGGGPACFALVLGAGLAYTLGAIGYGLKRPRLSPHVFGYHELFHAGTLLGASLTFWAIDLALR